MGRAMSAYAIFLTVENVPYALARCCFKARRSVRERTQNFNSLFSKNIHSLGYGKRASAAWAITLGIQPFGAGHCRREF
jgi:hypothetical protein